MLIHEVALDEAVLKQLIRMSEDWEAEHSCFGYRANTIEDIEGNRIFFAEEEDQVIGYLFGNVHPSKNMWSIMPEETPYFEVEELYVIPERRSQGIGAALFRFAEEAMPEDVQYVVLSTATKNWRAIFHFYIEELQMEFWSARLFKRIKR